MPMSNALSVSGLYIPDPDIGRTAKSIRALFVAILTRALKDIFKPTYNDYEIYKTQALNWIAVDDRESITSFINVCNHLEFNPEQIRRTVNVELKRMKQGLPHRIKFKIGSYNMQADGEYGESQIGY